MYGREADFKCERGGLNEGFYLLQVISSGAKLGIEECQYQLQSHRWNCSVIREAENVFGKVLEIRELFCCIHEPSSVSDCDGNG